MMKNFFTISLCLLMTNAFTQGKYGGGIGDGFAVSQSAIILPVQLVSFQATIQNGQAQLTWTAITENIASFTVEVSSDGNRFEFLTEKAVISNTMAPVRYGYADGPRSGLWYYRLKWTEADGSVAYSNSIALLFPATGKLIAFYEPGAGMLTIQKPAHAAQIELFSTDGRLVKLILNGHSICRVSINDLPAGLYIIRLKGHAFVARFVK